MFKNLLIAVATTVFIFIFIFTGCAPQPDAGTKPLKLGLNLCLTGKAAEKCTVMAHGKMDCFKYINEELGGVEGHPIELHWYDNSYDAAKSVTVLNKLMEEGSLFFTTNASYDMSACMEIANRSGFAGMAVYSSPVLVHPPKHIYAQVPDYGDGWAAFTKYYVKNIWKGSGKPKMALHLLNNTTGYGVRDAARALASDLGIDIVATEEHTTTTVSEIESLTRIKGKNPDIIFIASTPAPTSVIIKNAKELNMYPGIPIASGQAGFTKKLIDLAGADVVEGVYGVFPTVLWGEDVPGMAKLVEYCKKYHPEDEGNLDYLVTWAEALIDAEILRQAVKNTDYAVLAKGNEESWQATEMNGFKRVKNFDVRGLHGQVDFSNPEDYRGSKTLRIYQVKNGTLVAASEWVEAPLIKYETFDWFGK